MFEYPKINSLWKREGHDATDDATPEKIAARKKAKALGKKHCLLIPGEYSCEEFATVDRWTVTEKIDGMNIRIGLDRTDDRFYGVNLLEFGGRTANAQIPVTLLRELQILFPFEVMDKHFEKAQRVFLFGEGYGPKIQSGGYYRSGPGFILFDVWIDGWWLDREGVSEVASKIGITSVPTIRGAIWTTQDIIEFVKMKPLSYEATVQHHEMEGVVARSYPQMLFRNGLQVMFKLKCSDF